MLSINTHGIRLPCLGNIKVRGRRARTTGGWLKLSSEKQVLKRSCGTLCTIGRSVIFEVVRIFFTLTFSYAETQISIVTK